MYFFQHLTTADQNYLCSFLCKLLFLAGLLKPSTDYCRNIELSI